MTNDNLIEEVYKRCTEWTQVSDTEYEKLFAVGEWGHFYNRPLSNGQLQLWKSGNAYSCMFTFISIDDGDIPLLGPNESYEKAMARFNSLKDELSNFIYIPEHSELQNICIRTGMYLNL